MTFKTLNILDKVKSTARPYNILTFNTHERYQTQLAKTGHNFYAFNDGGKDWLTEHAPMPSNYYQLPKNSVYPGIVFDFIMVNSKFGQFQTATQINKMLGIPILSLEHTLPLPTWPDEQLEAFKNMNGDINVFITEYSKDEWGMKGGVIEHSVDMDLFCPAHLQNVETRKGVLTVAHDFIKRDYALNYEGWKRITKGLPSKAIGETPGLSKAASTVDELVKEYQKALIYINPSILSPVPTSMLEAMSCGCAVVTTATCDIPSIIEHGVNGFMSNDEDELRAYITQLIGDPGMAHDMGVNARGTILNRFSEKRFVEEWNETFDTIYSKGT